MHIFQDYPGDPGAMIGYIPIRIAATLLMLGSSLFPQPNFAAEPASLLAEFPRAHAMLETSRACHFLDIYLALSDRQRAQGLMYIRQLDEFEGMLFPTAEPAIVSMWMKNTYIALDMLFIRADGTVAGIVENTTPLSEASIAAPEPVTGVLELRGGFAGRHGVARGDRFAVTRQE